MATALNVGSVVTHKDAVMRRMVTVRLDPARNGVLVTDAKIGTRSIDLKQMHAYGLETHRFDDGHWKVTSLNTPSQEDYFVFCASDPETQRVLDQHFSRYAR